MYGRLSIHSNTMAFQGLLGPLGGLLGASWELLGRFLGASGCPIRGMSGRKPFENHDPREGYQKNKLE